jgi:hypothetical protein
MALIRSLGGWTGVEFDWRRAQAASDLKALLHPHAKGLIAAMQARGGPEDLIFDRVEDFLDRPALTLDPDYGPFSRLWREEALEATSGDEALPLVTALLANALLDLRRAADLAPLWQRFHAQLQALPPAPRAAIFCAFREVLLNSDLRLDPALETDFCQSQTTDAVCAPLQAIAARTTVSELQAISLADYGQEADRHLKRLIEVIEREGCVIPETDAWYPLEVVQLVSHVPHSLGWLVSTAVVLVTAVRLDDCWSDAQFRWFRQAPVYRALEPETGKAVMDAIRHIYQASLDFALTETYDTADNGGSRLLPPERAVLLPGVGC